MQSTDEMVNEVEAALARRKPSIEFKAKVVADVKGEGYEFVFGHNPVPKVGAIVVVSKWFNSYSEVWKYRLYVGARNICDLQEAKAQKCLRALRDRDGKRVPLSENDAKLKEQADDTYNWEMSR